MIRLFLFTVLLLVLALALLSIRVLVGRHFVHTHIDGNKALNRRGIRCVKEMERDERRENRLAVKEKSDEQA